MSTLKIDPDLVGQLAFWCLLGFGIFVLIWDHRRRMAAMDRKFREEDKE